MGNGTIGKAPGTGDRAVLDQTKKAADPAVAPQPGQVEQKPEIQGGDTFTVTGGEERTETPPTSPERT